MHVIVGSPGRFHTFDLARELESRKVLRRIYTAYPKYKVDTVDKRLVASFPWIMVPMLLARKLGLRRLADEVNSFVLSSFDAWMARRLERCDVFHCLSGFGLASHSVAKEKYGALTICDRGSTHILKQNELLRQEHARWGLPYRDIDRRIVERELMEYEVCDRIFVPSTFVFDSFVEKGIAREKLVKIPYGVDLSLFHPLPKTDDVFRVLYVGALSLRKGLPYLLDAVCGLDLPRFEVWLIGDVFPEVVPFLKRYTGRYRYLGVVPRRKLAQYYSQASVFVLPSIEEGLALVQAQAMACGLPVIATPNTGSEDLFTSGIEGYVVPPGDPAAIREKVLHLYEQPMERQAMSEAAMRRVRSIGGWREYCTQIIAAYAQLGFR